MVRRSPRDSLPTTDGPKGKRPLPNGAGGAALRDGAGSLLVRDASQARQRPPTDDQAEGGGKEEGAGAQHRRHERRVYQRGSDVKTRREERRVPQTPPSLSSRLVPPRLLLLASPVYRLCTDLAARLLPFLFVCIE